MRLSYCYPAPDRIREGVRRLAAVLEAELAAGRNAGHALAGLGAHRARERYVPAPEVA
jgi:hypothetical protein